MTAVSMKSKRCEPFSPAWRLRKSISREVLSADDERAGYFFSFPENRKQRAASIPVSFLAEFRANGFLRWPLPGPKGYLLHLEVRRAQAAAKRSSRRA